jgi:hypothetical protein
MPTIPPAGPDRLVAAARDAHAELGELLIDLAQIERRMAAVRSRIGYAVTSYDSGAVIELPDGPHDPRD